MDFHKQHDRIWSLAQEKRQWPASVITKMNFGVPLKSGIFLLLADQLL